MLSLILPAKNTLPVARIGVAFLAVPAGALAMLELLASPMTDSGTVHSPMV